MNPFLFFNAYLSGKMMSTKKFENLINTMPDTVKRYRTIEQSEKLKEYKMLQMTVNSDFFRSQKKKAMSDKNTKKLWPTSDEGQQEARLAALGKDEDILFFQQTKREAIENAERFTPAFIDDFTWTSFQSSPWQSGFKYPSKDFQADHSYINELQAYNKGNNVATDQDGLHIYTRKETTTAPAWDPKRGLVMHQFPYTSDVINNNIPMSRDGGMVMVKARCRGYVNHGAYLRSPHHLPMLFVFDYTGFHLYCGLKTKAQQNAMHLLYGLHPITYIIYSVVWDAQKITWLVNNMPVHTAPNTLPSDEPLYLHLYSNLFPKQRHITQGSLDVQWVKCYNFNK